VPTPSGSTYRLARKPDPWAPPDWVWLGEDGTFGNRFDDPRGMYRVLYASSQRVGCFLETLARFRIEPTLLAEFSEIEGEDDFYPLGTVPLDWFSIRIMGSATVSGDYADIGSSEWISRIRLRLIPHFAEFGLEEFDASTLQKTHPRSLTQRISRFVFESRVDGIYYRSKYGHDIDNWALFEPFNISDPRTEPLRLDDPDLQAALKLHGLKLAS